MTIRLKILSALLFLLMLSYDTIPQPQAQKIRQITTKDGLLTPGVKFTYKDSKGFMWFAFSNGIARYDGYTVKRFDDFLPDSCSINSYKFCTCFFEDSKGNFWIGTLKNGFAHFDRATETFTYYNHPTDHGFNSINCFMEDSNGDLWLGSRDRGLYKFLHETDSLINFNPHDVYDQPGTEIALRLLEDSKGNFWVGTGHGIFQFDRKTGSFTHIETEPKIPDNLSWINHIVEDTYGDIWFATNWGVMKYHPLTKSWKHYSTQFPDRPYEIENGFIEGIAEVNVGNTHQMWFTTSTGLLLYDFHADTLAHFNSKGNNPINLISSNTFYIFCDYNNLLWISSNGLIIIDPRKMVFEYGKMYTYPDSLTEIDAWCFYEDKNETLWVGSFRDGLYKFDKNLNFIENYKSTAWDEDLPDMVNKNRISMVYEDSDNNLWVGTAGQGLSIFDRESKTFNTIFFETLSGKKEYIYVTDILEDGNGKLWFATYYGLYSVDRPWQSGQPLKHVKNPSLAGASLLDLMEDSQGRIWATTANRGLYCIKPNDRDSLQARRYLHEHYSFGLFTDRNVHEVYEDINHNIWMRSVDALFKYNESIDSIEYHAPFNDLFKGDKYNFTGDNSGHLWFITEKGLLRYNPVDNTQRSLKLFGQSDGFYFDILRHTDINKNRSGQFHIGGTGEAPIGAGFCRFHPDSVHGDNLHLPEIVITDFKIRNEPAGLDSSITWKKHIRLKHNQNFFSFEFAAIEYRDPEKNQHAFMLEGFDEDWNYSGTRRFANYTGVPPGEYIFRVKGSNNDGYWNEKGTAINLTILPPPWKTWWAYTLYSLLTISLIYIWRRYDLKRHRLKQALEIEHVEAEKLKELDKMKSRFFANISHEFRTPLTLILGPIGKLMTKISDKESIGDLNMMQRNALRLQNLINQLLTLSKLESDQMKLHAVEENLTFLVKGYVQSFESLAIQRKVKLTLISNEENIPVFIDRDKLEKILYNLLSNAFKFTGEGGRIEVEITPLPPSRGDVGATPPILKGTGGITSPWVSISVTDTGRGIPIEKVPHIFDRFYQADDSHTRDQEGSGIGLALTKELVELHHGKISVKSELHSGTVFSIWFPMGRDHLKEDEIVRQIEKMDSSPAEVYKPIQVDISEEFTEPLKGPNQKPADFSFEDIDNGKSDPVLLIVEDNSDLRAYIRSYLDPGFKVIEAFDGEHGLRKATELIPDLIVSDVMMPKMDGVELCMRLKTDERTSHIPVILLTAKASIEDKLEGLETGADDFITKPFDPQELQVRIKNLISQREKLREYYTKEIGVTSTEPTGKINSMDQQFLQKLKKIVDEKMNESDFGVENLSSEMAMSRVQMHRKLKALLNQSAGDLIRYSRLQQAAKLLKSKSKTVTEIAYQVGFNNLSYFAKCFQEQYGVNPSEY